MMRNATYYLTVFLTLLACGNPESPRQAATPPNVVLFLIDDFGYGDISFEGNTQIRTPNMDRIAQNGAQFSRFYQGAGACAPTRASLLTGRYHLETGVWGVHAGRDFLLRDEVTLADVLSRAGYATGAFGKWHSGKTNAYFSWNRGFDTGVHPKLYQYFDTDVLYNNKLVHIDGPVTDVVGREVQRFIRTNQQQPFFCYVPFQSIHEPFNCPDDVFHRYKAQGYSDHVARLYGMIKVLDNNIGAILNTIDSLRLTENTVILFMSDDGPSPGVDLSYANRRMNEAEKEERSRAWGKVHRGSKAQIWEGGQITPFYIQWKGHIRPGKVYDELAGVIDIFPTVLDLCGLTWPADAQPVAGRSLWPLLQGQKVPGWEERMYFDNGNFYRIPREQIDFAYPQMHYLSVHYKNYKLVRTDPRLFGGDALTYELFDLAKDSLETHNLWEEEPEMGQKLRRALDDWYAGILQRGRAFGQAVYEVGNWNEQHLFSAISSATGTPAPEGKAGKTGTGTWG